MYLAKYGNFMPIAGFEEDKKEKAFSDNKFKKEKHVFTNWSDVNEALENYSLFPEDEMHEPEGTVYKFTVVKRLLDENGEVTHKYEYKKIK